MGLLEKLTTVQNELKVGKDKRNEFGGFNYRSVEDVYNAVKPLLKEQGLCLYLKDTIETVGDRIYIKTTAMLFDNESGDELETTGWAREPLSRPKMDESQVTGSCSSYARKYALNAMFLIDDNKDIDSMRIEEQKPMITEEQKETLISLGADLEKLAIYLKKHSIDELTEEEAENAIARKGGRK